MYASEAKKFEFLVHLDHFSKFLKYFTYFEKIELTIFHAMLKVYSVSKLFYTICFTKTRSCWEQVFVKQIVQNSMYTEYIFNIARKIVNSISFLFCFDNMSLTNAKLKNILVQCCRHFSIP